MAKRNGQAKAKQAQRTFTDQFRREAVQMMLDGHSAASVAENLGINNPNLLYRWKAEMLTRSGAETKALDSQVLQLREELQRTKRERDILKKAMSILSQKSWTPVQTPSGVNGSQQVSKNVLKHLGL